MANRRPLIINASAQQIQEISDSDTLSGSFSIDVSGVTGEITVEGSAPASATSSGTAGDIRYDASYLYVCVATNTWKRSALATW
jgi:hypothetical protein